MTFYKTIMLYLFLKFLGTGGWQESLSLSGLWLASQFKARNGQLYFWTSHPTIVSKSVIRGLYKLDCKNLAVVLDLVS